MRLRWVVFAVVLVALFPEAIADICAQAVHVLATTVDSMVGGGDGAGDPR